MALDPAIIEKLRENSRIRLDREGRFWHEDAPVEHPLVAAAFHRGLGRAPDGRPTVSFGRTWCYIAAESSLLIIRTAICEAAGDALAACRVRLDDETEEEVAIDPGVIGIDLDGVLYLRVKDGNEWARLLPAAQAELGRFADTDATGSIGLRTVGGIVWPVELDEDAIRRPATRPLLRVASR